MTGATSPYAPPRTVTDEPTGPRSPDRPALFVLATFVIMVIGPGIVAPSWKELLELTGTAARGTWHLHVLACTPVALALLLGLLSDRRPIMDTRRESYVLLGTLFAAGAWLTLLFTSGVRASIAAVCGIVAAYSIADVAIGGAMVEIGRRHATTGRLSAAWIAAIAAANLAALPLSELVGRGLGPKQVGLCAGLAAVLAIFIIAGPATDSAPAPAARARPPLGDYLRSRTLWSVTLVLSFASLATVSTRAITGPAAPRGLWAVTTAGQLAGAILYAPACLRMPLARSARLALLLTAFLPIVLTRAGDQSGAALNLALLALGLVEGFQFASLTDLLLRASPRGHEAFACALFSGLSRLGGEGRLFLADAIGASASQITTIAAGAAIVAALAISLVPRSLTAARDGGARAAVITARTRGG
jgi:MFS family permease